MIRSSIFSILALGALTATSVAEHYRVYLLGGQSNGNGRADAAQLAPPLDSAQNDVRFYWHRTQEADNVGHLTEDQWIDLAPGSGHGTGLPVFAKEFGSEITFGRAIADANPAAKIAIIKYTHGGTTLANNWAPAGAQYTSFISTVQTALTSLTSSGHTYELRGMLWAQGETDTNSAASADNYQANLTNFIARVRTDLFGGDPAPFVLSTISNNQYTNITTVGSGPHKVRQAQEVVAATVANTGIVNTDGYPVRSDIIHFDHDAMITLGQAFAAQMQALEGQSSSSCGNRPNVIFILGDDQSWYDYSFMYRANVEKTALDANPAIRQVARTPALDRLVDEGILYTRGYATPLCRPSLASILTGVHPHQSWITGNDLENRPPDQAVEARMQVLHPLSRTLANRLGYTSFQTGKWWEGHFSNGGFTSGDTVNSTANGTAPPQWAGVKPSYATARHGDWGLMIGRVDYVNTIQSPAHPIPYPNTVLPVTDFIDTQKANNQPFFIWYAPFLPHTPHDPPAGLLAEYTALGLGSADANYYANVERFDGGVGAILDHLDATGLADNTIVVMICDNGRDMDLGKRTPYEGGVRTPIIVRWPDRIKPGGSIEPQVIDTPVSLVDMVPTVHHALGLPLFPEMTGIDLLDPAAVAARDTIYGEDNDLEILDLENPSASLESRFALRDGWKLILFIDGSTELYHLYDSTTGAAIDPFEANDLSTSNPALVTTLSNDIVAWYNTPKGQQVSNSEAATFTVASDDLLQTSLDASTPVTTLGNFTNLAGVTVAGEPALRDGLWNNDGNGSADTGVSDGASVTYHFDLAASPLGYTVEQIDLFSNWGPGLNHDEIRVSIDYAFVDSPTNFENHIVIEETYNPPTLSQGKMSIFNIGTAGVAAIRFTFPASQESGSVGYSELDVIGTADGSDITPPDLEGLSPNNGASAAPTKGNLVISFCEVIQTGTGFIKLFESGGTLVESFNVTSSPRVTVNGTRVIIDPTADLTGGSSYYVQIDTTAIVDLSGNSFEGFTDTTSWSFTADGTPPLVITRSPVNGQANVLPTSALNLTFDEAIQSNTGNITIHLASNGNVVESIDATGASTTINGATVSINIGALALDTAYFVSIDNGAFSDLSGNLFAGHNGATTWAFTTAATTAIHHWEFEGNATDSIGTHHGTLDGDVSFAAGKIGQAASFDGLGDAISTGADSLPATDFTLSAWVNPSNVTGFNYVAGTQNSASAGAFLRVDDGVPFANLLPPADSKRASGGTVPLATWTHLAVTVDSTSGLTIYVDGVSAATDPAATGHTVYNNFRIGDRPDGTGFGFNGLIDDLRIYESVLPAGEIAELAGGGEEVDTTPPGASSFLPGDDASEVAIDTNLQITFNENVRKGTSGNIVIRSAGGSTFETIPVTDARVTISGAIVTINPNGTFANDASYYVNLSGGAIEDLAGNDYAGISDTSTWNFTSETVATSAVLMHHWTFDNDGSDSIGTADATLDAGATITTTGGRFGEALSIPDASAGAIVAPSTAPALPVSDFTYVVWVNPNGIQANGNVMGNQLSSTSGAWLRIDTTTGFARVNRPPGTGASGEVLLAGSVPANQWTHLAMSVSSTSGLTLFVNGTAVGTNPAGVDHTLSTGGFAFGRRADSTLQDFFGLIDDAAIFEGVLNSTQLTNVINLGAEYFNGSAKNFTSWIANPAFGLSEEERTFNADPDGDGLANGLEAWFGTNPGESNIGLANLTSDGTTTTFTHPRNENQPGDLNGDYEWSPNLIDWYAGDGIDGPAGGPTLTTVPNTVGPITTVNATASEAISSFFLRVRVIQQN